MGAAALLSLSLSGLPVLPAEGAEAATEARGYIVVLKDSVRSPSAAAGRQTRRVGGERTAVYTHAIKGYAASLTSDQAAALAKDPEVRFVSPQRTYRAGPPRPTTKTTKTPATGTATATATATDCETAPTDRQCRPLYVDRLRADRSSTRSGDGRGSVDVKVAVLDSGIAGDVPDLNVRGGVDCLSGSPVVPGLSLQDPSIHGTPAAGIIGARDDGQGLVGIAPGTPLWSVKIADDTGGLITDASYMCAMDWLVATRTDADPSNDIAIANMSFISDPVVPPGDVDDGRCGTVSQDAAHLALCNVVAQGITPVAAAGNVRVDIARVTPAGWNEVITATAMADYDGKPGGRKKPAVCYGVDEGFFGEADDLAALEFSNFARSAADRRHTVAAPGVCMEASTPLPLHHSVVVGTSFAAPATSGVLALCIHSGRCGDSDPARNLKTLVADARAYNEKQPHYGFFGDPHHPVPGRHYGPLVAADRY
ncbi:S8 family serine peptidase [Streptomyces sp. NPDC004435]|uniref:S8 family serine peptidase n=1 Tax=Streptomyces sp. NPDC004435 TaxID=3364701 RepID=UPI0036CC01C5